MINRWFQIGSNGTPYRSTSSATTTLQGNHTLFDAPVAQKPAVDFDLTFQCLEESSFKFNSFKDCLLLALYRSLAIFAAQVVRHNLGNGFRSISCDFEKYLQIDSIAISVQIFKVATTACKLITNSITGDIAAGWVNQILISIIT